MFNPERNIDGIIDNGDIDGVGRSDKATRLNWEGSFDEVCDLLVQGIDAGTIDKNGLTAWDVVIMNVSCNDNKSWSYLMEALVEHGADVNAKNNDGCTPLHQACSEGNTDVVKYLVEHGADTNAKDEDGWTPLHYASMSDNVDIVECLIEHGADVNAKNMYGRTPLHRACFEGNTDVVKYLVEHGADMNAKDEKGDSPFGLAAEVRRTEIVQYMISHLAKKIAADVHAKDKEGLASTIQSTPAEKKQGDLSASLRTTLKDGEEKDEPVSASTAAKGMSDTLSDEYTRGNDVSISIANTALMKNKGR